MEQYGDEAFIYVMAHRSTKSQSYEIQNDINNGYIVIRDKTINFSKREIVKDKLYMTLPSNFKIMLPRAARFKYPGKNRPHLILTDESGSINIHFTFTKDQLKDEDTELARDCIAQAITTANPERSIISSSVIWEETHVAYFDFICPVSNGEVYNLVFTFSLDEQLVLGNFNCLHFDKARWQDISIQMLRTIRKR